jgi:quinoprotein glucose dehydrogenase
VGSIVAIDVNTGEHLWRIPNGDASQADQDLIRNHPVFQNVPGVLINRGRGGHSAMMVTETLLIASGQNADGAEMLFGIDKRTGQRVGAVPVTFGGEPIGTEYGMSGWIHEGRQHIMVQTGRGLVAYRLPE